MIAGTGSNDTRAHRGPHARAPRTAASTRVLVVTPYYNKPPERGLLAHFRAVAAATSLPVIVYNIPVALRRQPVARGCWPSSARIENIVAVKQANPDLERVAPAAGAERPRPCTPATTTCCCDVAAMGGWGGICVASHLVGPRMDEVVPGSRAAATRRAPRPSTPSCAPLYRGAVRDREPDPGEGGAEPARARGRRPAPAPGRGLRRRTAPRRSRARRGSSCCKDSMVPGGRRSAGARGLMHD